MSEREIQLCNEIVERESRAAELKTYPEFPIGGVPVKVVAAVFGKSETWVREGIRHGILPIGCVTETENRTNVYISPKLLWEYTGYLYKPE